MNQEQKKLTLQCGFFFFPGGDATVITLQNRCTATIWPRSSISGHGKPDLVGDGVALNPGQTLNISTPAGWSGEVWARTECSFDQAGGINCATGYCDPSLEECGTVTDGPPPTTSAMFMLDDQFDSYFISLLGGFNIPLSIVPSGGSGECKPVRCLTDLNLHCPSKLQVRRNDRVVGCKSACWTSQLPEDCCIGTNPDTCKPSSYSKFFKDSCPSAFTFGYYDPRSHFTCTGADYLISFC